MKQLVSVLAVVMVGSGSVLAMTSAASETKTAAATKDVEMAVVSSSKDAKDSEAAVADQKKPSSDITIDPSSPEAIYKSIKGYTDKIVQKTGDDVGRASMLEQLGMDISAKYQKLDDILNDYGMNALHVAAQHNDVYVTRVLLAAGFFADSRDDRDNSPRDIAASFQSTEVIDFYVGSDNGNKDRRRLILDFAA